MKGFRFLAFPIDPATGAAIEAAAAPSQTSFVELDSKRDPRRLSGRRRTSSTAHLASSPSRCPSGSRLRRPTLAPK
jgi:hypothetical protein